MTELPAGPRGQPWFKKTRAAALGFGLGATLALSPLWAQSPPASSEAGLGAPCAMYSSALNRETRRANRHDVWGHRVELRPVASKYQLLQPPATD